ncbi:MAG TPA: diaminopimelate epimerase [Bacteroidales bacterium]|nr:diaminopimelate epimerase [Bacteroidales bacterium]
MTIAFNKYQGTGNDFIIIDNRKRRIDPGDTFLIQRLCDRRFGIGADGLILISDCKGYDFQMKYFNADGGESSMCGNGGRCAAAFAVANRIAGKTQQFLAFDGVHNAVISGKRVRLSMNDVSGTRLIDGKYFINTGSPHYIVPVKIAEKAEVIAEGRKIRYSKAFSPGGTNVNFVEFRNDGIFVRTYERGVEDETLSCGTGVTASAIAAVLAGHFANGDINVFTRGGNLNVKFDVNGDKISGVWLTGPATFVYEGAIEV